MASSQEFEQSKAYLSQIDPKSGSSLYTHLTELLHTILHQKDGTKHSLSEFEKLSVDMKKSFLKPTSQLSSTNYNINTINQQQKSQIQALQQQLIAQQSFKPLKDTVLPDLHSEHAFLQQQAGITLPYNVTHALQMSLISVSQKYHLTNAFNQCITKISFDKCTILG
jgi:hypothetical protein